MRGSTRIAVAVVALAAALAGVGSANAASGLRIQQVERVGVRVVVQLHVPGAGRLAVMGGRAAGTALVPAQETVGRGGDVVVTTALTPTMVERLRHRRVRVCVAVRFRSAAGAMQAASRFVTLPRTQSIAPIPVTG